MLCLTIPNIKASSTMMPKLSHLLLLLSLTATVGCASHPVATAKEPTIASVLDAKIFELCGPEADFTSVEKVFTSAELKRFREHSGEVEAYLNGHRAAGSVGAAWIAGYFRIHSSLPLLRNALLTDRYFYGWEGPDPNQESSYLSDEQYPHHLAYIAAIEAISGRPLGEAVTLTPEEISRLQAEAKVDFAKLDVEPEKVMHGLCARWLLQKLGPSAVGGM
jgi:hypothetical protein